MRVRSIAAAVLLTLGAVAAPTSAQEQEFVIIVNTANPIESVSVVELRRIYLKQARMWSHGEAMVPVDWVASSEVREAFSEQVMNRSVREMSEFWIQEAVTRGVTPPPTQRSARSVLRFVASVPGAISYLPPDEVNDTVKVITLNRR